MVLLSQQLKKLNNQHFLSQIAMLWPFLQYYRNKPINSYFPKVVFDDQQLVMLYPGDGGYENLDVENKTALHRCIHDVDGWHYHNEIGLKI